MKVKSEQASSYAGVHVEVLLKSGSHYVFGIGTGRVVKISLQARLSIHRHGHKDYSKRDAQESRHICSELTQISSIAIP